MLRLLPLLLLLLLAALLQGSALATTPAEGSTTSRSARSGRPDAAGTTEAAFRATSGATVRGYTTDGGPRGPTTEGARRPGGSTAYPRQQGSTGGYRPPGTTDGYRRMGTTDADRRGVTTGGWTASPDRRTWVTSTVTPQTTQDDLPAYSVKDANGQTCVLMLLDGVLSIQYKNKENETRGVQVRVPRTASSSGFCHENEAQLSITWTNFELRWNFIKDVMKSLWSVESIELDFKKTDPPFEDALITDGGPLRMEAQFLRAPLHRAYHCQGEEFSVAPAAAAASASVAFRVRRFRAQPFMDGPFFGPSVCLSVDPSPASPAPQPLSSDGPLPMTTQGAYYYRDMSPMPTASPPPFKNMPSYRAPTLAPYVYKKVRSNMVKIPLYPTKKIMSVMNGEQSDPMNSMLWSWYMSGFYTGYYQALQQMKKAY